MNVESMIVRKMTAAFFVTMVTSMILAYWYMSPAMNEEPSYRLGVNFLGWTFFYTLYVGAVVLLYGNLCLALSNTGKRKGLLSRLGSMFYVMVCSVYYLVFFLRNRDWQSLE